jgi:hypothetical protein
MLASLIFLFKENVSVNVHVVQRQSYMLFCKTKWNNIIAYEHGDKMQLTGLSRNGEVNQISNKLT